jgi:hypothetical protein
VQGEGGGVAVKEVDGEGDVVVEVEGRGVALTEAPEGRGGVCDDVEGGGRRVVVEEVAECEVDGGCFFDVDVCGVQVGWPGLREGERNRGSDRAPGKGRGVDESECG